MKAILKQSLRFAILMMLVCGIIYPLTVTGIGQTLFHQKADGSLVYYKGRTVGSKLLGQDFTDNRFFRGRVSSIHYNMYTKSDTIPDKSGNVKYSGVTSGSSNLAPSNKLLVDRIKQDVTSFLKSHPSIKKEDIPADLVTNSGSGLDPEISIEAARIQIPLISKVTGISEKDLNKIVDDNTSDRSLGVFGEKRVNVLLCNLEILNILKL